MTNYDIKLNATVIVRLLFALFLIPILAVVLLILGLAMAGKLGIAGEYGPSILSGTIRLSMYFSPAIIIASLAYEDTKKMRLLAATKSIVIVFVLYLLILGILTPLATEELLYAPYNTFQVALSLVNFLSPLLPLISVVLTVHWLPSLKPIAVGDPPSSVRYFERLILLSLGASIVGMVIGYDYIAEQNPLVGFAASMAPIAAGFLVTIFLTIKISREGSKAMRMVLLVSYVIGSMFIIISGVISDMVGADYMLTAILSVAVTLLQGFALYLLFTPASNKWFGGDVLTSG